MSLSFDLYVEMAFGHQPNEPNVSTWTWTDVTDYLVLDGSSPAVTITRGRGVVRGGISPGEMTFTLDNSDGRFSPTNTDGPFYGQLKNGVPVRVRVLRSAWGLPEYVFSGFVASGWPQVIGTYETPTVTLRCHDALGFIAQSDAPETAWHATVSSLATPPDQWWTVGPDGWSERMKGLSGRHTGVLVEFDDALVDGEEGTWGQEEPDGFGISEHPDAFPADGSGFTIVSARVRLTNEGRALDPVWSLPYPHVLVSCPAPYSSGGPFERVVLTVDSQAIRFASTVEVSGTRYTAAWSTEHADEGWRVSITDDSVHMVTAAMNPTTGQAGLWIDGREVAVMLTESSSASATRTGTAPLTIGNGARTSAYNGTPYQGVIDHVLIWEDFAGSLSDVGQMAAELADAGRLAWAGQTLDQRYRTLIRAFGLGHWLSGISGAIQQSGIVTLQGYRPADPLELLQKIEDTEQGRVWVDQYGFLRFDARDWPTADSNASTPNLTFTDDPTLLASGSYVEMLPEDTVVSYDPRTIVNVAEVNSTHGRQQVVEDRDSIAEFGRHAMSLSGLLHPHDRQSRSLAEWLVRTYSQPQVRVEKLAFLVDNLPDQMAKTVAMFREGWRVRIIKKMPQGPDLDVEAHVIGIEHRFSYTGWTVVFTLDASRTETQFFRWGASNWGGSDGWAF